MYVLEVVVSVSLAGKMVLKIGLWSDKWNLKSGDCGFGSPPDHQLQLQLHQSGKRDWRARICGGKISKWAYPKGILSSWLRSYWRILFRFIFQISDSMLYGIWIPTRDLTT